MTNTQIRNAATFIFNGATGEKHYWYKGVRIAARFFDAKFPAEKREKKAKENPDKTYVQ